MKNKLYREIDKNGRIIIPVHLREMAKIEPKSSLSMVPEGKDIVVLVPEKEAQNVMILYKVKMDEKGRIVIPTELREGLEKVEIFFYKGRIALR